MVVFDYGTNARTGKRRNKCAWVITINSSLFLLSFFIDNDV
jgi:hypothetical protein